MVRFKLLFGKDETNFTFSLRILKFLRVDNEVEEAGSVLSLWETVDVN